MPPFCSRLKWRSLVFNDSFTFSVCSASVVAFHIFLKVSWKKYVVKAWPRPPFGAHVGSMLTSSGTRWHPLAASWVAWVTLWAVDLVTVTHFWHFHIRPNPPKLSQTGVFDDSYTVLALANPPKPFPTLPKPFKTV